MKQAIHVTSLKGLTVQTAHLDDGSVDIEWIQLEIPKSAKRLNLPLVRIPDNMKDYTEEYFKLHVRTQEALGRSVQEAQLILWNRPQRFFISAYELNFLRIFRHTP